MEDNNKAQDPQSSTDAQPDMQSDNINQHNRENTYWESSPVQNSGNPDDQFPGPSTGQSNVPNYTQPQPAAPAGQWAGNTAQTPVPTQTPEQFYQYYQQQMGSSSGNPQDYTQQQYNQPAYQPVYQTGAMPKPPKKKRRGAIVAIIVVLLLLFSAAGTAYAFRATLSNTFAKMTKSPAEYYSHIEKNELKRITDDIVSSGKLVNKNPQSYELTSDFKFNRDTLDPLLESGLGLSLSDLEELVGIQLEKIGLDATVKTDGKIVNNALGLRLNDAKLITAELFTDIASQDIFLRLPELSQAYLNLSASETLSDEDLSYLEKLSNETLAEMLNRYGNIVIDGIKQVEMEDDTEISVDTLSTKCTRLTVTISEEDANQILIAVLEEAKNEETILGLLPMLDMTEEVYQDTINSAIAELKDTNASSDDDCFKMEVYVNSKGEIIRRSFGNTYDDASLGFTKLSKGSLEEYRLYVTDNDGEEVLNIQASHTKNNKDAFTGDASITFNDINAETSYRINVSYSDVRSEEKDNHIYNYGTIEISSMDLMGLQVTMDFAVEDALQKINMDLRMGAVSIVSADMTVKYPDDNDVTMPPADAKVFEANDMEGYTTTFNLENYFSYLNEQLGVDVQEIMDYFNFLY